MKRIFLIGLLALIGFSCDDQIYTNIPWAPVSLTLYLNDLDSHLMGSLSYKKFTTARDNTDRLGYAGILVINGLGPDVLNLRAYDLACQVEHDRTAVVPDSTGLTATCPKCGAVYNIALSGAPIKVSKYGLQRYNVSGIAGGLSNTYKVTN